MTVSTPTASKLDLIAAGLKENAGKLADVLREHAALKLELESAASEADAAGFAEFAQVFRDMAANLCPSNDHNVAPTATPNKRRGRPPKSSEQPSVS